MTSISLSFFVAEDDKGLKTLRALGQKIAESGETKVPSVSEDRAEERVKRRDRIRRLRLERQRLEDDLWRANRKLMFDRAKRIALDSIELLKQEAK